MFNLESLCGVEMTEDLRLYRTEDMRYKGIICDQQDQLIVQNFAVPTEFILPRDHEAVYESFRDETFPLTVYESIEGTILRVYWFGDEWRVSTTSRIDAFGSSWASEQSFGDQSASTHGWQWFGRVSTQKQAHQERAPQASPSHALIGHANLEQRNKAESVQQGK